MIREIKKPKPKSDKFVMNSLVEAIEYARSNKVVSLSVTMVNKTGTYTNYVITPEGSWPETIAGLERCKATVMNSWIEKK